ncbi:MAG: leucyl/phenylalanyl-tRNA--protein transferase [Proteobacteria bacterium]|nr:leucyl/phenylalanyl-tRNA--protein transferase [Pseudomonadota bacterium]MCH8139270.1 leucyl/phenylalanyl-tRNA--protein transferase [Pseudomonadota bacterium]TDI57555.1 MAG: leucyl/phenylalanyl-tRNA--protein transferase [Alphaproteobacteria bacterium]
MSELTPDILLRTYAAGIFPMAESAEDPTLFWVDPETRGILPLEKFRVSRGVQRKLRRHVFEVRCDTAFEEVVRACAAKTSERPTTWINEEIIRLYLGLHAMGHAHSVECWQGGELAGGLYGVCIGGAFFGESMFSRVTDASKIALAHLVARLRRGGYRLLDTQFVTSHLEQFGVTEVGRGEYQAILSSALAADASFYRGPLASEELEFRQSLTQIS